MMDIDSIFSFEEPIEKIDTVDDVERMIRIERDALRNVYCNHPLMVYLDTLDHYRRAKVEFYLMETVDTPIRPRDGHKFLYNPDYEETSVRAFEKAIKYICPGVELIVKPDTLDSDMKTFQINWHGLKRDPIHCFAMFPYRI